MHWALHVPNLPPGVVPTGSPRALLLVQSTTQHLVWTLLSLCWVPWPCILSLVYGFRDWLIFGILGWIRPFLFVSFCCLLCFFFCVVVSRSAICPQKETYKAESRQRPGKPIAWGSLIEPWRFQFSPDQRPLDKFCCESPTEPDKVFLLSILCPESLTFWFRVLSLVLHLLGAPTVGSTLGGRQLSGRGPEIRGAQAWCSC